MEPATSSQNIVVVITSEGRCALQVDAVSGILNFAEDQVEWDRVLLEGKEEAFFKGIGKRDNELALLLDPVHIIPSSLRARVAVHA